MTALAETVATDPGAVAPEGAGEPVASPPTEGPEAGAPDGASESDDPLAALKAKAKLSDSLQKELRRLHGVLKATKEQNQRLRAQAKAEAPVAEQPAPEQPEPSTEAEPPAESALVEFAGMHLSPEVAERLKRAETLAARLEQLEGEASRRDEEALASEIRGVAEAYETNTERAVVELRRQVIPLEGEAEEVADEVLLALVNKDLARAARDEGLTVFDLTPEKIHEFGLRAVDRLHKAFSVFGAKQLESNQQYRETHRAVRPGGSPAVQPPKGWKQMTPAERELRMRECRGAPRCALCCWSFPTPYAPHPTP